ncbi:class I SAM-dependent methyltransferase [Thermomonospora umbrina]|uniref:Methyltransferase family protein n=1 Tax=Thermomonospora umbrina TaxID=111806 RepID=A0A3D9SQ47_9ACTN|nr:class I SAM-dependent methyltransferase [Thermomonospora umbrina]REE95065.1 methyltransferase family protein [Thermomonospora umbrina]
MNEADRADEGLGYAVNTPYYDLIFPEALRDSLAEALVKLTAGARTVAEIGPGTGYFTEVLVERLGPEAQIFAVEPARIMRAALMSRLAAVPGAAGVVTVLPEDALTVTVDVPLDAVVLLNLIMHFDPDARKALWRRWAEALRPGGLLITESQYPQVASAVPPTVVPGRALGRYRYDTLSRADVVGEAMVRWVNTYRTWEGERLVREETAEFDCHVISDALLTQELTDAGLERVPEAPAGIQVWRRPDTV